MGHAPRLEPGDLTHEELMDIVGSIVDAINEKATATRVIENIKSILEDYHLNW